MKHAIYPGSFDPVTSGHLDIIERAAHIFDQLTVTVMINASKKSLFSPEKRVELLKKVTRNIPNVTVESSEILLADYAKEKNAVVVKGLRAMSDFEREFQMALVNRRFNPDMDTMFLTSSESHMFISSSLIKEISSFGGDLTGLIPDEILSEVAEACKE